ncbi:MAG: WhiB family transcriptional regulator [Actinomycetota bacterium]
MTDLSRLPPPLTVAYEWQLRGACRGVEAAVFFLPDAARGPRKRDLELAAKAICRRCPVLSTCAEFALSTREVYGVWGGLTPEEREFMWTAGGLVQRIVPWPGEPAAENLGSL